MRLESGPASGDRNRYLIIFLMTFAFGCYFIYDGAYGYVSKNRKEAALVLPKTLMIAGEDIPKELGDKPTKPMAEAIIAAPPREPSELREKLGDPMHIRPGTQGETYEYYVSDYGMLEVKLRFGKIVPDGMVWTKWPNSKAEIENQYYWSIPCFLAAGYALIQVLLLLRLRVTIDDQQMVYSGTAIPFSQMKGFDNFSPKGWVDLLYNTDSGEQKLRLDNYRVARYDEILDALVESTSLSDPRPAKTDDDDADDEDENENDETTTST